MKAMMGLKEEGQEVWKMRLKQSKRSLVPFAANRQMRSMKRRLTECKNKGLLSPLRAPWAFLWVSTDERLGQLHTNKPAGLLGLYAMLGTSGFKRDSWMDKNPNSYILFSENHCIKVGSVIPNWPNILTVYCNKSCLFTQQLRAGITGQKSWISPPETPKKPGIDL